MYLDPRAGASQLPLPHPNAICRYHPGWCRAARPEGLTCTCGDYLAPTGASLTMTFRYLPHTADLRAKIDGPSLPELYQSAVDLIRNVIVGDSPVVGREARRLPPFETDDPGEALFRFVRELIYLYDSETFIPVSVEISDGFLLQGESFDPARHLCERGIKALTRHGFRFGEKNGGYEAELIFDL